MFVVSRVLNPFPLPTACIILVIRRTRGHDSLFRSKQKYI
jgi:hypothetical protein